MRSVSLNYDDLIKNYNEVITYIMKCCDLFSVITNLKKPYSKVPPICEHDMVLEFIKPYIEKQIVGIREWPGTKTRDNHKVMCVYRVCKTTRQFLINSSNYFTPTVYGLPEDICFYKKDAAWLVTVSHEKISFINQATEEDIAFLRKNNIQYY